MTRAPVTQIKGLLPLIDPKRVGAPFVISGQNFAVDADGPVTAFAREEILHMELVQPKGIQSFRIKSESTSYIFTTSELLKYDDATRQLYPLLTFTTQTTYFPWSHAVVGGYFYFARKGVGLIEQNTTTGVWSILSGANIPTNIVACAASGGRLVVLAEGLLAWSAIDDGADLLPSTTTGAGFQSLAMVNATGADEALMVLPYANGVLTYTTNGIMKSELIQSVNPFRHRPLSSRHIPINPWCVIRIGENDHVLLTKSGFYSTAGEVPAIWQDLMAEYFHQAVLPRLDLDLDSTVRLSFDFDRGWFFASIADGVENGNFNKAWMLYVPSGEWGQFNRVHTAFVDFRLDATTDIGFHLGYVEPDGSISKFTDGSTDIVLPDMDVNYYELKGVYEWPARRESSVNRMPTVIPLRTQDEALFQYGVGIYNNDFDSVHVFTDAPPPIVEGSIWDAGLTTWDAGGTVWEEGFTGFTMYCGLRRVMTVLAQPVLAPLDAYIEIGVFRGSEDKDIDEVTSVFDVAVSALDATTTATYEDYIDDYTDPVDTTEDWGGTVTLAAEDYGFGQAATSEYQTQVRGTVDGYTTWENQLEVPTLVAQQDRTRFMSCNVTGMHHLVKITADEIGESFHVKTLELNAILAGRLR